MEVVGAVASIVQIVGAGAKLSLVLFDFANAIGSAGAEVRIIATEISLFCSVLKQLEKTLDQAKKTRRYSLGAIQVTQQILDQCKRIFEEIEEIIEGLWKQKGEKDGEDQGSSMSLGSRFKWTFVKKSKLQMHRATLESCKITLHLMLTTLEFAQKVASRRVSTQETDLEDEQDELVAQSLVIAQRYAVEQLEKLEDEESSNNLIDDSGSSSTTLLDAQTTLADYRLHRKHSNVNDKSRNRSENVHSHDKRKSVWLQDLMSSSPMDDTSKRESVESSNSKIHQLPDLLWKWSDQGPHWNYLQRASQTDDNPGTSLHQFGGWTSTLSKETSFSLSPMSTFSIQPTSQGGTEASKTTSMTQATDEHNLSIPLVASFDSKSRRRRPSPLPLSPDMSSPYLYDSSPNLTPVKSPTSTLDSRPRQLSDTRRTPTTPTSPANPHKALPNLPSRSPSAPSHSLHVTPTSQINNSKPEYRRRESSRDTYEWVLGAALKKKGLQGDQREYRLYIVYDGGVRPIELKEKPRTVYSELKDEGKHPKFMLQRTETTVNTHGKSPNIDGDPASGGRRHHVGDLI